MTKNILPKSKAGKWSVGLNAFFLISVIFSVFLVKVLKILSFDDRWWDITVGIAFPAGLIAFIAGSIAEIKYQDRAFLVRLSVLTGTLLILFLIFHSLFIND